MKILITIIGPTAVGKSSLAIRLAQKFNTVILSSDSRQMYRFMDIGTAKPTAAERRAVRHYFIDNLNPNEAYNAARFEAEAEALLKTLFQLHEIVIVVGGSTLYIDALWNGFDEMPKTDPAVREALNREFKQNGLPGLVKELEVADPETHNLIDRNNPARVIRALEVFRTTGQPISVFRKGRSAKERDYRLIKVGLEMERKSLYLRINQRVDDMMQAGLPNEVYQLMEKGYDPNLNAMQSIGYRELSGLITEFGKPKAIPPGKMIEAIELIKRNSRRYAKRQMSWYRKYTDILWFEATKTDKLEEWIDTAAQ